MTYNEIHFEGTDEEINAQWLENRKHGIGGSDAATVLGLNNYATPYTLWLEKTGRAEAPDLSDNEKVYWGNVLEDVLAGEFAKRHGEFYVRNPTAVFVNEEHPFMFASVDRLLSVRNYDDDMSDETDPNRGFTDKAVLEIKTCGERRRSDWDEGVPSYYLAQVNHYLAVTGLTTAYVAVLIGGQEYREYKIERDEEDINYLIAKEREFWQMVEDDTMPPFTGSALDNQALMEQFPSADDEFVQSVDLDDTVRALQHVKDTIKEYEESKRSLEASIRAQIGEHKGVETPNYRVTWTRTTSTKFDGKRLQIDNPDLYAEYCSAVPRDMGLRISKKK